MWALGGSPLSNPGSVAVASTQLQSDDGSSYLSFTASAWNGFADAPGASTFGITAPILLSVSLTGTADGDLMLNGGQSSAYPSFAFFSYQNGQSTMLQFVPETTPSALGSFNQTIPPGSSNPTVFDPLIYPESLGDGGGGGGVDELVQDLATMDA